MKNSREAIYKRQQFIIKYLKEHKTAKTSDLANILNTSLVTIRRDFESLENENIIKRSFGLATLIDNAINEDPYFDVNDRLSTKLSIAKKASEFVADGDTIFINSSSTSILMLTFIKDKHIFVITNNSAVLNMDICPKIEVVLTGGELYGLKKSMVGDIAINNLSKIKASKTFLGVSGIHCNEGISTAVLQEVSINKKMIKNCSELFILCDSSKIGIHHNFLSGSISSVDYLITDKCSDGNLSMFKDIGINVVLC